MAAGWQRDHDPRSLSAMRNAITSMNRLFAVHFLSAVCCLLSVFARGATVSWDGGGGNNSWHTAANWSSNAVPGLNDDVIIDLPGDVTVVHSSGSTTVRSLQCQEGFQLLGGTLTFTSGSSVVNGALRLGSGALVVRGGGTTFTGNGATTNETVNLTAEAGAQLHLPGLQRLTRTLSGDWIVIARDIGSTVNLPNLTQVSVADFYQVTLQAFDGGHVSLPVLAQVNSIDAYSDGPGSVIDLSGLQGALRNSTPGNSSLEVLDGGAIQVPNVTALHRVGLYITADGQIATAQLTAITGAELELVRTTNSFPNVTNILGSHLMAENGARLALPAVRTVGSTNTGTIAIRAWDANSVIDLPNVTNLVAEAFYRVHFEALDGGRVSASQLARLQGGISAHAANVGSVVSLPGFTGLLANPKAGSSFFEAWNGGAILISNVTALDRIDVAVRGNGFITLSQMSSFTEGLLSIHSTTNTFPGLTDVDASNFLAEQGGHLTLAGVTQFTRGIAGDVRLTARGGGVLQFPNVQSAQSTDFYQLELVAEANGRIHVPQLSLLQGGIIVSSDGAGSLVDIAGFVGQLANTSSGSSSIEVRDGGSVLMPNVTELHRIDLEIANSGQINTAQLLAFTEARLTLESVTGNLPLLQNFAGSSITLTEGAQLSLPLVTELVRTISGSLTFFVDGPGTMLDLSSVTAASVLPFYQLELLADDGGRIDLANLVNLTGAVEILADGTNSFVDLSSLQGVIGVSQAGQSSIEVTSGATVAIPNVTGLHQFAIDIQGSGELPTEQLTRLTQSTVTIDGTIAIFLALADTTGTTFSYLNGGAAVFQPPADLVVTDIDLPASLVANQPVQMSWEITNLGTAVTNGVWADGAYLSSDASPGSDVLIGFLPSGGSLAAGASRRFTNTVVFPAHRAGNWHPGVVANQSRTVFEGTNGWNNTNISGATIQIQAPDLVVEGFTIQTNNAQFGATLTVNWSIRNTGNAVAGNGWSDRILLTTNISQLAGAVTLLQRPASETLTTNGTYSRNETVALPILPNLKSGNYFLVAVADGGNALAESRETNNTAVASIGLTLPPLPDLTIADLSSPTNALPGGVLSLAWMITNAGTAMATGVWSESVFIAATNVGAPHLPLAVFSFTNTISPGAFLTRTQELLLPSDLAAGTRRFIIAADSEGVVAESNETNNTRFGSQVVNIPSVLTLQIPVASIPENSSAIEALVARNGSRVSPLNVFLASSDPGELTLPATVTIPAGKASATFSLVPQPDGVPTHHKLVNVTASGSNYLSATAAVTVQNTDTPQLTLQFAAGTVVEGGQVSGTVSRNGPTESEVGVYLNPVGHNQLVLPEYVTIPAGSPSIGFAGTARDDTQIEPEGFFSLGASAIGHLSASAGLIVVDNDVAQFVLSFSQTNISEGAEAGAAVGTISRGGTSPRSLEVELVNSNPGAISLPPRVVIASGEAEASFAVMPLNNQLAEGTRTVEITAFALATYSGERVQSSIPVLLNITDDDGPTLTLVPAKKLVAEGLASATTITVVQTPATNHPVTIQLSSSDVTEATVPNTVIIPPGQTNVAFTVTTPTDNVSDGSQNVVITATAGGFTGASAAITVSDLNLPDLVLEELNGPQSGESEAFVNVSYRVANRGLDAAGTNWMTRLYLSDDPNPGNDVYLTDYTFNGTLPVGQFFGQARQIRLPQAPGDYWLVVATDTEAQIDEVLENNNVNVAEAPIHVSAAYSATVAAEMQSAPAGTLVPLRGTAIKTSTGGPAPFVLVNVHVNLRGTRRIISALTDSTGQFAITFTPLAGEAGFYEIGAAHPGESSAPIQDSFNLFGLKAASPAPLNLIQGATATGQVTFVNLGEMPLTGLAVSIVSQPPNLAVTANSPGTGTIPGFGSNVLNFSITASAPSVAPESVVIRLITAQGAQVDIPLTVTVAELRARLVANPGTLKAGMKVGGQALVHFDVANLGGLGSDPIYLGLPDVSWMRVATPNPMPGLAPGATNRVTLQLTPPADMDLGAYEGWLAVNSGDTGTIVPFTFQALSEAKGDLLVTAVDEYTYFAEGAPKVSGATVTIRDAVTEQIITNGITGADGNFFVGQLTEGYYVLELKADKHRNYRNTLLLKAGETNEVLAFMGREAVQLIWTVTPTEIQDRTRVTIEAIFEAFVPMPVVTVDPPLIDLADFTADLTQIDLKISNHGLIAALNTKLHFGTHPEWSFEPLIDDLGDLPARSTLTVPLLIRRNPGLAERSGGVLSLSGIASGGGCNVAGSVSWEVICGNGSQGGGIPIPIINASASGNCGGGGVSGGGGGGGPGGGGEGGGGGGGGSGSGPASCDACLINMAKAIVNCVLKFVLSDALKCAKDTYGCASGLSSNPTAGTAYTCFKAVLNCLKAAGKSIPGSSLLKFPECAYDLMHACDSAPGGGGGGGGGNELSGQSLFAASVSALSSGGSGFNPIPPELRPLVPMVTRVEKFLDPMIYIMGDRVWLQVVDHDAFDTWVDAFVARIDAGTEDGVKVSATERTQLLAIALPAPVTIAKAQQFLDRWNRSIDYWNAGIFTLAQVPPGQSTDFLATDTWGGLADEALNAITQSEAEGAPDPLTAVSDYVRDLEAFMVEGEGGGVCAHVRLRIDQEAIVTRDAFNAALEIQNDTATALENIAVDISVRRRNGEDVTALFAQFPPVLDGVTGVDGSGLVLPEATGKATWTVVPTTDAVGATAEEFLVGGVLRYHHEGLQLTVPLAPTLITVHPSPSLAVKYFHQRDVFADDPFTTEVEPSVPYSLAVMVENKGHGAAHKVRIVSAQPQIVENEKGLYADFRIIATEVAGQNLQPSLTVEFGQIDPGTNAIGRWLLTSSILGGFIDYSATFEHLDGLGDKKLSLIEGVAVHELIHIVKGLGAWNDGRPDFLVNDVADLYDRPDTLHLSDGSVAPVSMITDATFNRAPTTNNLVVQMTTPLPGGWAYLRVPDPGTNRFRLARVTRSDGLEIPVGDNVWTTERTFLGNARRPLHESMLHLFDRDSTGAYTLYYANLPAGDVTPPESFVAQLPADSTARIPVTWSGQDNPGGNGVSFFDVYVSIDNAPFILWQKETLDRTAIFQGGFGRSYAFYSIATDLAGNREAAPFTADAQTTVTRTNRAPLLDAIPDQIVQEGDTLYVQAVAFDADGDELIFSLTPNSPPGVVIHPYTGVLSWVTGEGNGPSLNMITVQVLDNGSPRLGAVRTFQITVADENSPPVLTPISNRTVNEGRLLSITNSAIDYDLPHQTLTFSLAPGAPLGATLNPSTGVFQWQPAEFQGGTTNLFAILVQDNGAPAMTATQTFSVVVRDTQSDFTVGLGTTNLLAGSSNAVPIQLVSSADLAFITFELSANDAHLDGLDLSSPGSELASASFEPIAEGLYRLRMDFDPGQLQTGSRRLASLKFNTLLTGHSSIARLDLDALTGQRSSGEPLANGRAFGGRIFIIEQEPLLDSTIAAPNLIRLTLYGLPGHTYMLQSTPTLGSNGTWNNELQVNLSTTSQVIHQPLAEETMRIFRVRE